jgi:uncharacterized glyoxalase superfamily protein PhnB
MTGEPPEGYHSLTPRMIVADVDTCVAFLRSVFGAVGDVVPGRPVDLRIGDSLVMVSSVGDVRTEPFPAFLYVYVDDVDAVFARAVDAGAEVIESPADQVYGDRRAMVRDRASGNLFQIARRLA